MATSAPRAREAIVIFGAGGHASVVLDAIAAQGSYIVRAIIDPGKAQSTLHGLVVRENELGLEPASFIVALGNNQLRKQIFLQLKNGGWTPAVVQHPTAVVSPSAAIGAGTVLFARAVVNPGTTIGENCIVNTGATIDHDCKINAHSHVGPGANIAGSVSIEEGCLLGIGSCVTQNLSFGDWSTLGAGGAAIKNVAANTTVAGVPAKPLKLFSDKVSAQV